MAAPESRDTTNPLSDSNAVQPPYQVEVTTGGQLFVVLLMMALGMLIFIGLMVFA
jgi:hypothetical protein